MITDDFLELIFPDRDVIDYKDKDIPYANNIIYHSLIVFGFPGSGKTTWVNSLAGHAIDKYKIDNVYASFSESGDLNSIINNFNPRLINLLYTDNATLAKYDDDTLHSYFMLRNLAHERYGITNGYILSIIALHRYYSIPVEFRSVVDGIIIRDVSLNPYDNSLLKKFIDDDDLFNVMKDISVKRRDHRELMNFSIFIGKSMKGLVYMAPRRDFYFTEVGSHASLAVKRDEDIQHLLMYNHFSSRNKH